MKRLFITILLAALLPVAGPGRVAQAAPSAGPTQDYIVKPGDTLLGLAMQFGTTVAAIQAENNLTDPNALKAGQTIKIPAGSGAAANAQAVHVVQPGDTLLAIGVRYGVQLTDLTQANGITEAALLQIGQRLVIPAGGAATNAAPAVELIPLTAADVAAAQAPAPAAVAIPATAADADIDVIRGQLLELYNQVRVANGVAPLAYSATLQAAAQGHAEDCAARGSGSHFGSDGSRSSQRIARAGYTGGITGENWAWARSAAEAFEMWYTREIPDQGPHLKNILSPRYAEVGFGIARSRGGFYLIANFGAS